jgi:hypothetical protein
MSLPTTAFEIRPATSVPSFDLDRPVHGVRIPRGGPRRRPAWLAGCLALALAPPALRADVEYVPAEDSPGWLSIDTRAVQFAVDEIDPCLQPIAVGASPLVNVAALRKIAEEEPGLGSDYTFAVEAEMRIEDERGGVVVAETSGFVVHSQLAAGEGRESERVEAGRLTLGWDGLVTADGQLAVAAPGRYTLRVALSLEQLFVDEPKVVAERLLDTGMLIADFRVRGALEICRAWEAAAPKLGEGNGGVVVLDGRETHTQPWVRWRRGVPQTVFGNLGRRSGSTSRRDTVRDYLASFADLYDLADVRVADSLDLVREIPQADGDHLLILEQALDDAGLRRPIYGSKLTAQFDADDRLVLLTGVLAPRLPGALAGESYTESDAVGAVIADLSARGLHTNRVIGVARRVAYESAPGLFEPAYLVGVDSNEPSDENYHYVVSASSLAVLHSEPLSSRAWAAVTVQEWDPNLVEDNDGNVILGSPTPVSRGGFLRLDGGSPVRLEDTVNNWPSSVGVISETFFDAARETYEPEWNDLVIDRFPDSTSPSGHATSASLAQYRAAFVALDQIQEFWDRLAAPWSLFVDRVDVHFRRPTNGALGVYRPRTFADDEIHFPPTYDPTSRGDVYTPTHEIFHHFDEQHVDLETGCTQTLAMTGCPSDDHRMPFALKEGLAELNIDLMDGFGVNNSVTKAESLLCIFVANQTECFQRAIRNYRKNATDIPRPQSMSGISSQWPDCRTDTSPSCFQVGVDGAANDLPFPGQPPSDTMNQEFVPQLLLDLWETGASTIAGALSEIDADAFAAAYGDFVVRAYLALCDDASLPDLRDALRVSALETLPSMASHLDLAIEDVFSRHGIDAALDAFCAQNEDQCH